MIIPSSLMCGSMPAVRSKSAGAKGEKSIWQPWRELQYDLQSSILLPENNLSSHKSDL